MRALQTGNYLDFKEDFERALSSVSTDKGRHFQLNVDITTPDACSSSGDSNYKFYQPRGEKFQRSFSNRCN